MATVTARSLPWYAPPRIALALREARRYPVVALSILMFLLVISLPLPTILLALVLVAAVGPSFGTVIIVLVVLLWARYARLVRGETLAIKERDFIARGRVAGASHTRIMVRYIFPNVVNSLV